MTTKTLRELAERSAVTRRRLWLLGDKDMLHPQLSFAQRQYDLSWTMLESALGTRTRTYERMLVAMNDERAAVLAEVCVKLTALRDDAETKDYDSYYEGMIDGLNTALDEIEALQKKDKKNG